MSKHRGCNGGTRADQSVPYTSAEADIRAPPGSHYAEIEANLRRKPNKDGKLGAASLLPELQEAADAEDEAAGLLKEKTSVVKAGPKSRAKSRAIVVSDDEVEEVAPPPGE